MAANQSDELSLISYNLTDLHAKARAAYVSSGDDVKQANNMIDDQPGTVYNFAASDSAPMAVIDLGRVTKLRRISAIYSPAHGTMNFYVLQALPAKAQGSTTKNLQFDDAALAGMQSVGSVTDDGTGRAAVDFPETSGRYIMLKWTPTEAGAPFSVAEIAAFGGEKSENLIAANNAAASSGRMSSDGKTMLEGKDFKEMPEEGPPAPEEGPGSQLPAPPPFVFVPEVLPLSP